jgi:hypothetical protein
VSALVFGEADPKDYLEPLCKCGHALSEHYDGHGSPPPEDATVEDMACCWAGWERLTEGCQCLVWRPR